MRPEYQRIPVSDTRFATRFMSQALLLSLCFLYVVACKNNNADPAESLLEFKRSQYQRWQSNMQLPLLSRLQPIPGEELKSIAAYDESIGIRETNYKAYFPAPEDKALFAEYFNFLPQRYRETLEKRLLMIYFIDGFAGAGLTDWVVDEKGQFYYFMILNSNLLEMPLDEWLSYRENAYFDLEAESFSVSIDTNTNYKALIYGLLHESSHIIDYEYHITPYLDELHKSVKKLGASSTGFTANVWFKQKTPVLVYDFVGREKLNPYGIFSSKALLPSTELGFMLSELEKTPFVSFYSGVAWYEDFADYVTYHYIEKHLGGSIRVDLLNKGEVIKTYFPAQKKISSSRSKVLSDFF